MTVCGPTVYRLMSGAVCDRWGRTGSCPDRSTRSLRSETQMRRRMFLNPLARPSTQLDDPLVQVEGDVHLARLERPVLGERQSKPARHLHLAQPHPFAVSREVLHEDREHGSGYCQARP